MAESARAQALRIAKRKPADEALMQLVGAMEVVGGGGFYRDIGLERAFRDAQTARFHPLQKNPQLRYSERVALGLDIDGSPQEAARLVIASAIDRLIRC